MNDLVASIAVAHLAVLLEAAHPWWAGAWWYSPGAVAHVARQCLTHIGACEINLAQARRIRQSTAPAPLREHARRLEDALHAIYRAGRFT